MARHMPSGVLAKPHASVGALLSRSDLSAGLYRLRVESRAASAQRKQKSSKRLKVVEDFRKSNASPTWMVLEVLPVFFFSSRRRHTRFDCDWSSDVCSSD